jgi:membrane protein YdbS with pleckstrin-like domain
VSHSAIQSFRTADEWRYNVAIEPPTEGICDMNCNQCGAEAPAGSAFCPKCGASLTAASGASGRSQPFTAQRAQATAVAGQPPEKELWAGSYSPKAMIGWFLAAGLVTIAGIVLISISGQVAAWIPFIAVVVIMWAALAAVTSYNRLSVRYNLTTYRLFHEKGLLSRTRDRIEVIDIDDVTLSQGPIERLLNIGTIHIISSDESLRQKALEEADKSASKVDSTKVDGRLDMPGIDDVRRVADLIDNTRRAERNRRGVFLENV